MADFLLELRSEEIPARMQGEIVQLRYRFLSGTSQRGLHIGDPNNQHASLDHFVAPRRMALIARDLPDATAAFEEELKGPRTSAPDQALEGFLRKTGLTKSQLTERDGVWFAIKQIPGRPAVDVLAEVIPEMIRSFNWPKSMRWGGASLSTESLRWVRPLSGIVALLDEEIVPFEIDGIPAGRTTLGHRFHSQGEIAIAGPASYAQQLRAHHVIVDHAERQAIIRAGAAQAAEAAGLVLVEDEGLVEENAGLTEWPVPLLGRFDEAFLEVPAEVIQLTARANQKYFICRDAGGTLANAFICTANIVAVDGGAAIVAGNRKVLAARLSDARFFWEQDRRKTLAQHAEGLARITFHEKLGTVADKVERVAKLARWLVEEGIIAPLPLAGGARGGHLPPPNDPGSDAESAHPNPSRKREGLAGLADLAEQAARLCKADLVTEMVGEFPELQGVMGGYYARAEGLPDEVADAIRDHYKPVGQGDAAPTAPVTVAVSFADKLDTLVGFFGRDMPPTGSKDPFALRRACISLLSLWTTNGLRTTIAALIAAAIRPYEGTVAPKLSGMLGISIKPFNDDIENTLSDFIADRLKIQQKEADVRHDLIDAVFALGGEHDVVRLLTRVHALQSFITTPDGTNLLAGYKRAANILKKEGLPAPLPLAGGARGGQVHAQGQIGKEVPTPDPSRKREGDYSPEPAEAALMAALSTAAPRAEAAIAAEDFVDAMAALAALRAPIDGFFEQVTVNDPDQMKRATRLGLLDQFRAAVHKVADFSLIEG